MSRVIHLLFLFVFVGACSSSGSSEAAAVPPPAGVTPPGAGPGAEPVPCSGKPGTFHDQPLNSAEETRHYWLHVPPTYRCAKPTALVVDFHGTGYGTETDTVEESWATPELESASDDASFIVVRPRSRMKPAPQGGFYYQWDINPGDIAKNKAFALALVDDLRHRYHVDPARIYATGFSNGPSMAAQFLGDEPSAFHGYGLIAGGLNAPLVRKSAFGKDAPRIYTMTGFRDYMLQSKDILDAFLSAKSFPTDHRFDREADTGHEVYGWHFREAFAWMDRGARPAPGQLNAQWVAETTGTTESLVEVGADPQGALVAVGSQGGIFARGASGTWTRRATLTSMAPLTDVCFLDDGRGFAVGHGHLAVTTDGSSWSEAAPVPEFGGQQFGYTYATSVACAGTRVTVGGVWSSATSIDGGKTWSSVSTMPEGGAFISAIRASGTSWLALGYWNYIGRSTDGAAFDQVTIPGATQWWNDGAFAEGGRTFAVGEGGAMRSSSDGTTWSTVTTPTIEDLYAVAFRGSRGAAVGAHGTVIVTADGGASWTSRPTGLDGFFGGVRFADDTTLIVTGEHGSALRMSF
jgi:predicted esterase